MKLFKAMLMSIVVLTLFGCASQHQVTVPADVNQNPMTQVSDAAGNQIAEAAASVSRSLTDLEAVEKANMAPRAAKIYPQVAQMQIPGTSSVDWNGPIQPLLMQIAKSSGYRLKVYGNAPLTPVIVNVHAVEEANADVVRDAALQAGIRASVKANPATKTIELRYQEQ